MANLSTCVVVGVDDLTALIFATSVLFLGSLLSYESNDPGFNNLVKSYELLTPCDIEEQYNCVGGHWHHGEMGIDQSFMMRPVHGSAQYKTPCKNLYLCGASAHPGGGITGLPGHNAAKQIIRAI